MELRTEYLERALQLELWQPMNPIRYSKASFLVRQTPIARSQRSGGGLRLASAKPAESKFRIPKFNFERNRPSQVKQPMLLRRP